MIPTIYQPIISGHVYQGEGQWLEAVWQADAATWRLYVVTDDGEYIRGGNGAAYGL